MSSWPIWIIFGAHCSAHHPLQFIPYNHRDQTTSSWSAGQLKSSQSAKSAKLHGKTWISPWVLIRFGICFHGIQALNLLYNASHTSVLNRPLLPEALASWNPQNQQKQRISIEKPQQLHEFLSDLIDFWFVTLRVIRSTILSIQSPWSENSFLERWSVEVLQLAKLRWKTSITSWVLVRSR